jgi:hypothetical protein
MRPANSGRRTLDVDPLATHTRDRRTPGAARSTSIHWRRSLTTGELRASHARSRATSIHGRRSRATGELRALSSRRLWFHIDVAPNPKGTTRSALRSSVQAFKRSLVG